MATNQNGGSRYKAAPENTIKLSEAGTESREIDQINIGELLDDCSGSGEPAARLWISSATCPRYTNFRECIPGMTG
jgi:hypothetical protein